MLAGSNTFFPKQLISKDLPKVTIVIKTLLEHRCKRCYTTKMLQAVLQKNLQHKTPINAPSPHSPTRKCAVLHIPTLGASFAVDILGRAWNLGQQGLFQLLFGCFWQISLDRTELAEAGRFILTGPLDWGVATVVGFTTGYIADAGLFKGRFVFRSRAVPAPLVVNRACFNFSIDSLKVMGCS